ncbi:hypothetical protein [Pseudomonas syringae]|uniref:hypothetical protein n=1 Tax=Pseudomonas syringae TaxID=317 RepID=UPI001E50B9DC|nr:hypothetical protein [Pseudomonas syringae]UOF18883.1 hypothetical protein N023_19910 [Pseudomonas syringae CC440]
MLRNNTILAAAYNNDFKTSSLTHSKELKDVFTLGKAEQAQLDRVKDFQEVRKRHELIAMSTIMLEGEDGKHGKMTSLFLWKQNWSPGAGSKRPNMMGS